ncbi:MAG TPA: cyclic peptide export ABC transporter [Blastocatellia bacterium]|nr:cyclic peptide export ABC transporter [Blastocatellia bacterium]
MRQLIAFLFQYSRGIRSLRSIAAIAIVSGAAGGLASAGLLALINRALSDPAGSSFGLAVAFFCLCLLVPIVRLVSEILVVRISTEVTFDLRRKLFARILSADLSRLEENGPSRLMATLTDDVNAIANTLTSVPTFCINLAVVVGCLIYLAWLSWVIFALVIAFAVVGTISYQVPINKGVHYQNLARENWDQVFKHFRSLTEGIKELKLHRPRRRDYSDTFMSSVSDSRRLSRVWMIIFSAASHWSEILVFILIGLIVFILPTLKAADPNLLTSSCITVLYMLGPMTVLISTFPILGRASVAIMKIQKLGLSLGPEASDDNSAPMPSPAWESLELSGVTHTYHREDESQNFTLGPLDMTFVPGEMVFITGGNGSGKTTLIKLIAGLYTPEAGEIRLNGRAVTGESLDDYRQLFSVVFSDFYLFERLFGLGGDDIDVRANDYLAELRLEKKVKLSGGMFSTTELSQGQRKRLALLTARLENRPIYIFDEWAADQDPVFRDVFYYRLLPELKSGGKTVIVVTHDDRYYEVADRVIKLDYGKVQFDRRNKDAGAGSLIEARVWTE